MPGATTDLSNLGKWIIIGGLVLTGCGVLVWLVGKAGLPVGSLPGDIRVDRKGVSFYFPVVTCILVSVGLTLLANLVVRLLRR